MSYQVLARKWRPKNFQELQGQEHVSRALVNAIETERLHHAYLFTGTRGVGKTTIARILSKCLNCEANGLTATPCGECASCVEIDQGRFVDLIEVDAASRTKVDDTRELLENVQYRPTRGRYKVYLIDEVHMLSNSSFNALLKTLEEPPEHVIFLLATTDPQKLPVTVLSRCLQFHLKHMDEQTISNHLAFILGQESIEFEQPALNLIAQSAEGSMRDGLSLLDQAIAFGQGKVQEEDIRTMLGTIDHQFMVKLLEALANKDSAQAIHAIDEMSNYPVDFADALKELLSRLHQIAIYQATQVLLDNSASYIKDFAEHINPEDIQLFYQLGLHARRDLAWAPSPKQGLEMALLRMLAFQIDTAKPSTSSSESNSEAKKKLEIKLEPSQKKTVTAKPSSDDKLVKASSVQEKEATAKEAINTSSEAFVEQKPVIATEDDSSELENQSPEKKYSDKKSSENKPEKQSIDPSFNLEDYGQALNQAEPEQDIDLAGFMGFDEGVSPTTEQADTAQTESLLAPVDVKPEPVSSSKAYSGSAAEANSEQLASLHAALGLTADSSPEAEVANSQLKSEPTKPEKESLKVQAKDDSILESLESLSANAPIDPVESELAEHDNFDNAQERSLKEAHSDAPQDLARAEQLAQAEVTINTANKAESAKEENSGKLEQDELPSDLQLPWDPVSQDAVLTENVPSTQVASEITKEISQQTEKAGNNQHRQEALQSIPEEPLAEIVPLFPPCEESQKWYQLVKTLDLPGSYNHILQSSCVVWHNDSSISVNVIPDKDMLYTDQARKDIQIAINEHFNRQITIEWLEGVAVMETPAMIEERLDKERHRQACQDLYAHPFVQQLQQEYGARLDRNSIQYLD